MMLLQCGILALYKAAVRSPFMSPPPNSRATIGAVTVLAAVLFIGVWVLNRLDASQRAQQCAERGGGKCAIIENPDAQRR